MEQVVAENKTLQEFEERINEASKFVYAPKEEDYNPEYSLKKRTSTTQKMNFTETPNLFKRMNVMKVYENYVQVKAKKTELEEIKNKIVLNVKLLKVNDKLLNFFKNSEEAREAKKIQIMAKCTKLINDAAKTINAFEKEVKENKWLDKAAENIMIDVAEFFDKLEKPNRDKYVDFLKKLKAFKFRIMTHYEIKITIMSREKHIFNNNPDELKKETEVFKANDGQIVNKIFNYNLDELKKEIEVLKANDEQIEKQIFNLFVRAKDALIDIYTIIPATQQAKMPIFLMLVGGMFERMFKCERKTNFRELKESDLTNYIYDNRIRKEDTIKNFYKIIKDCEEKLEPIKILERILEILE